MTVTLPFAVIGLPGSEYGVVHLPSRELQAGGTEAEMRELCAEANALWIASNTDLDGLAKELLEEVDAGRVERRSIPGQARAWRDENGVHFEDFRQERSAA